MHIKKTAALLIAALVLSLAAACSAPPQAGSAASDGAQSASQPSKSVFTDACGYEVELESWSSVVSLYGSFAETWLLAGGTLAGTTEDAVNERGLSLGDGVKIIGTVKEPNFEEILALSPDFVILSADIEADTALHGALTEAGIAHAYYRVDSFDDYLAMLRQFCDMTGRDDLYELNGESVKRRIAAVLDAVSGEESSTALLLRAFSTGVKAKGDDILAGVILTELGAENIIDSHPSLLDDLSMEEIIAADPDYIFVVPMGADTGKTEAYLAENIESNPAWSELSAVKNGRYIFLPKELFHYKPNELWGESYAYLAKLLYPDVASKLG